MTSVVVPGALADRLEPLLGTRVRSGTATVGGHSNLVFMCTAADGTPVVVKAATTPWKRADIEREAAVLEVLADGSVPVPELVGRSADDDWAVLVTRRLEGRNGLSILADLRVDDDMAVATGRLLARVLRLVHHSAPRPLVGEQFDRARQVELLAKPLETCGAPDDVIQSVGSALSHVVHGRGVAFVHGDPGLHNLLWGTESDVLTVRCLMDWEMAGWGNPLSDVAWVWWTFALRDLPRAAFDAFAGEYGVGPIRALGWADDTVDAVVRAQMGSLLVRTEPGTALRDIWIDRIRNLSALPPLQRQ